MSCLPVIIVSGLGQSKLTVVNENGENVKNAWPVDIDTNSVVNDLKSSLMKMMLFRKDAGFSDKIADIVKNACEPLSLDENGRKKHNIKPVSFEKSYAECSSNEKSHLYKMMPVEKLGKKIGEDKLFFFTYDFFSDVYDVAEKLNDFIGFVKNKTNSEQVNILTLNIGGIILKAYFDIFSDNNDICKTVNFTSILNGTSLAADVFDDKLLLDNPTLLFNAVGGKLQSISSVAGMLPSDVIENTVNKSLAVLKESLILRCTIMWGCIPTDRFSSIFNKYGNMSNELKARINHFYDYSTCFPETAKKLCDKGVEFYQICGYGKGLLPICQSKDVQSDSIIDTFSASLSLNSVSVNEKPDVKYCVFPEKTWFFKEMSHNNAIYNDVAISLVCDILSGEVDSVCEKYPQFNGSRNIKKLKNELIPKAEIEIANGENVDELKNALCDYEKIISNTVINDDNDVKELESRLSALLESKN